MELTDQQVERYARHIVLPEIGEEGQEKLLESKVLVIGAGGLGSPLLLYLAAAGVGTLGVIDDDVVDFSNLQRQVVHDTSKVGVDKVESAKARIAEINPDVKVVAYRERLVRDRALELVSAYDVVADGSDNFATRYLVNEAPTAHPCQRCIFPSQPEDPKQGCADMGVMGALAGTLGAMQANEVIKELLGIGESLSGRLLLYDSLASVFREVKVQADPACPLCGPEASLHALEDTDYGDDSRTCAA
jgi:adenylyltransferase/sulfurtransferase